MEGGIPTVLDALRAHSEEDALTFINLYESLTETDKANLSLEEVALACGIGSLRLVEVAVSGVILMGQVEAKLTIATSMSKVAKSIVKAATESVPIMDREGEIAGYTNGDVKAMELFGKMSGMVPVPKGATIAINTNVSSERTSSKADDAEPSYLDPGQRLRMIHDAVEQRRLPTPPSEPFVVGGALEHLQQDVAETLVER